MSAQAAVAPTIPIYGRPRRVLGDPAPLACTVAKTVVEATTGRDGLDSLVRWVVPEVLESLRIQHAIARRAGLKGADAHVARARVCRVSARSAEVSIVATAGGRARAVAMRFEDIAGRWCATVVEVV
jgi:hypothetical protein